MSDGPYITKGSRVHARWMSNPKLVGLAGVQMKLQASMNDVVGVCRHFRGDDPTNPTNVLIYLDPDDPACDLPRVRPHGCTCDHGHVEIKPAWIIEVLP